MAEWLANTFNYLADTISGLMTRLIVAVIILFIGFIVGRVLGKLSQRILHELEIDRILKETANVKISFEKSIAKFVSYFIYFLAGIIALNQLGLTTTILHMISAAVLIVIILSILIGIKDFIPNFLGGLHIYRKRMIKVGDVIKVKGTEGKIVKIELTDTKLKTKKGDTIFIPNSLLIKEEFVKVSGKRK